MTEFDPRFLALLACPVTKKPVQFDAERNIIVCPEAELYYPILNGVPDMRVVSARRLEDGALAFNFVPLQTTPMSHD